MEPACFRFAESSLIWEWRDFEPEVNTRVTLCRTADALEAWEQVIALDHEPGDRGFPSRPARFEALYHVARTAADTGDLGGSGKSTAGFPSPGSTRCSSGG